MKNKTLLIILIISQIVLFAKDEFDCNAKVSEIDNIEKYLIKYVDKCKIDDIKKRINSYKFIDKNQTYYRFDIAWSEINNNFNTLALNADINSKMKKIYKQLALRAYSAKSDIENYFKGKPIPDMTALGNGAWKLNGLELELDEIETLSELYVNDALNNDCKNRSSSFCEHILKQGRKLMVEWNIANEISANFSDDKVLSIISKQVIEKDKMWDKYLYDSKPMLPSDFMATDWLSGENNSTGFAKPPKTQWFFMHPAVGVEYVSGAKDGEQLKPMLYLEIFGANRWNEDERWFDVPVLKYFSGFSIIASYADRDGVKDVGWGGLFTFDNTYSIGVNDYSGDVGVLFSIDIANLWRDKYKSKYEKYKNKF